MNQRFTRAIFAACLVTLPAIAQSPDAQLKLRFAHFDPQEHALEVPQVLAGGMDTNLWIVQFHGTPTEAGRAAVRQAGGEIHSYLPTDAYVVRMGQGRAGDLAESAEIRWVGYYHPAFRLDPAVQAELTKGDLPTRRYNIVVVNKHTDKPGLMRKIRAIGGQIDHEQEGSLLLEATLTPAQLVQTTRLDEVLWIDPWTPPEEDVDNARIQGGANYVEGQGGYTGVGINAHIYEGIDASHPGFSGPVVNVRSSGASSGHGTNTAGIVFGNSFGGPQYRGFAPDVGKFYTNYGSVQGSRYQVVDDLMNIHDVSHTTASWGGARTFNYTSTSAETDDIIFDHDMIWTQSQSNAGNQDSRPQAWAKNIFSIGGVRHYNNSSPNDDSWAAGGASTGPASDGRMKPTLCAYYDNIGTTSSGGGYTNTFGGTSGATPIVAGHNILAIEMFTDGVFGNQLRNPGGSRHSNRPKFTTLKALQVVSAAQYPFNAASTDNRREHQGWGFPDLQRMYDYRAKTFIIDETDVLAQGQSQRWDITVGAGEPDLKICMTHADLPGNPSAAIHRVNNLSLRVVSPSGVVYWGNNGLGTGMWSAPGGSEDDINPIECVFVQNPAAGVWHADIIATEVVQDSHVETPQVDADYGMVVSGGTGQGGQPIQIGTWNEFGQGCPGSVQSSSSCAQINPTGGSLENNLRTNEYAYTVANSGTAQVSSFDVFTRSTGGNATVGAYIYGDVGGSPTPSPIATTSITVGPTAAFYTATFAVPVTVTGTFYIALDHSAQTTYVVNLSSGATGSGFWRRPALSGPWSSSALIDHPSYRVTCTPVNVAPAIGNLGVPELGNSFAVTLSDAAPNSLALLFLGFSDTSWNGNPLPYALAGAPGCNLLVSPDDWQARTTSSLGGSSVNFPVPNQASLVGLDTFHQWFVVDTAVNNLGIVVSDAAKARIGG